MTESSIIFTEIEINQGVYKFRSHSTSREI